MLTSIVEQLASLAGSVLSRGRAARQAPARGGRRLMGISFTLPAGVTLLPFYTGAAGNFPYYYTDPRNLSFNSLTYNWINANLQGNVPPIMADNGYFTNFFLAALASINYSLSSADQAALNTAQQNATNQQMALLMGWRSVFGSLPPVTGTQQPIDAILGVICKQWASPQTSLTILQSTTNINTVLNNTPASASSLLPQLAAYLNALGSAVPLMNATSMNYGYLQNALAALQKPTLANGGLLANNQNLYPAYAVTTPLPDIINGLNNPANTVVLNVTVSKVSGSDDVLITPAQGSAENADISDFFSIVTDQYSNYFANIVAMSTAPVQVEMTFPGLTIVNFGPVAFNPANGQNWFWMGPITDAIKNGTNDVSGFKFSPVPGIDFSGSGPFGFLTSVAISNQPSFKIIAENVPASTVQTAIQGAATVSLSFLKTKLGGEAMAYNMEASNSNLGAVHLLPMTEPPTVATATAAVEDASPSATGPLTLTLTPATVGATSAGLDSMAWVHGVTTSYPAA